MLYSIFLHYLSSTGCSAEMDVFAKLYQGSGVNADDPEFPDPGDLDIEPMKTVRRVNGVCSLTIASLIQNSILEFIEYREFISCLLFDELQVYLLSTLPGTWMRLMAFESIRAAFMSVDFCGRSSQANPAGMWRPVVDRFLAFEVRDQLEKINFFTKFFEPLSKKKMRIFESEYH